MLLMLYGEKETYSIIYKGFTVLLRKRSKARIMVELRESLAYTLQGVQLFV